MNQTNLAIPLTLDEVTPEWLSQAFSLRYPGVSVVSAKVSSFFGYKPNKAKVQVEYDEAGKQAGLPEHLVVKGGFQRLDESGEVTGLDIGLELELMAYIDLTEKLDARTPRCFHVEFDPVSYSGIMLIEDLTPSGAKFLKEAPSLSYAQAAAFVDAMAKFHAQWFDGSQFAAGGIFGPDSSLSERTQRLHTLYLARLVHPEAWSFYLTQPRGAALPRQLQDAGRVAAAQEKLNELLRACRQTIIHGDEHLGNLYLDAEGKPGFIDWCSRREPWVIGFTYFLISTLDPLDRRQWERPLLQQYLNCLNNYGAQAPCFEEAWYFHRCTTLFPFLTWFNNSAKWQPEALNTRNCMRAALAVLDHDVFTLLGV